MDGLPKGGFGHRGVARRIDGFTVPVASCEDLVPRKLAAGRAVDLADAEALLAINAPSLDREYLERQAARMGLRERLAALR